MKELVYENEKKEVYLEFDSLIKRYLISYQNKNSNMSHGIEIEDAVAIANAVRIIRKQWGIGE